MLALFNECQKSQRIFQTGPNCKDFSGIDQISLTAPNFKDLIDMDKMSPWKFLTGANTKNFW